MIQWWHVYNPHMKKQSDEKDAIQERVRKQNDAFLMSFLLTGLIMLTAFLLVIVLICS